MEGGNDYIKFYFILVFICYFTYFCACLFDYCILVPKMVTFDIIGLLLQTIKSSSSFITEDTTGGRSSY